MGKKNDIVPIQLDIKQVNENIRRLNEEIDMLKIDGTTFRDLTTNQNRDLDDQVKTSTKHNHIQIKELENLLLLHKTEQTQTQEKLTNEVINLERDMEELRNQP